MEIERKFLVTKKDLPVNLLGLTSFAIKQGYLNPEDEYTIRIRSTKLIPHISSLSTNQPISYKMEIKSKGLLSRDEFGATITKSVFDDMFLKCKRSINKIRYIYPDNGFIYEIDEYLDLDEMTVEIEFKSEEDAKSFVPPSWIGKEVTHDINYKNLNLAV